MDFVFHELIQLSRVINIVRRISMVIRGSTDEKGAALLGLCTFGKIWSKADDNQQENPGRSKRK